MQFVTYLRSYDLLQVFLVVVPLILNFKSQSRQVIYILNSNTTYTIDTLLASGSCGGHAEQTGHGKKGLTSSLTTYIGRWRLPIPHFPINLDE